jgi:large subunit ribosomal protein L3
MTGIIGKKIGMTQLFDDNGNRIAVTVVEAGPCTVTQVRTSETDGYAAVQLAFEDCKDKQLTKAELGHLKKAGLKHGKRHLVEFRDMADLKVGDTVTVDAFADGQPVSVTGISKGKGFQGTIKRHNFASGPKSHGSHNVRKPGSIGASAWPSRVMKGMKMAGRMGGKRATQVGLTVHEVDAERNVIMVKGAIPGPKNGIVEIREETR